MCRTIRSSAAQTRRIYLPISMLSDQVADRRDRPGNEISRDDKRHHRKLDRDNSVFVVHQLS